MFNHEKITCSFFAEKSSETIDDCNNVRAVFMVIFVSQFYSISYLKEMAPSRADTSAKATGFVT